MPGLSCFLYTASIPSSRAEKQLGVAVPVQRWCNPNSAVRPAQETFTPFPAKVNKALPHYLPSTRARAEPRPGALGIT